MHDFHDQFQKGSIDIAQPSVTKIGGITEMRKIVALAEAKFGPALRLFLAWQPRLDPHCRCAGDRHPAGEHLRQPEANSFGDATLARDGKVRDRRDTATASSPTWSSSRSTAKARLAAFANGYPGSFPH